MTLGISRINKAQERWRDRLGEALPPREGGALPSFQSRFRQFVRGYERSRLSTAFIRALSYSIEHHKSGGKRGIQTLAISVARRVGKTTAVEMAVSDMLENDPDAQIMIISASDRLAARISRNIREVVQQRYAIRTDTRGKQNWALAAPHIGEVVSASVGTGGTGFGYDILVLDDPVSTSRVVNSEAEMSRLMDELHATVLNAANAPNATRILIGTRWSLRDPIGRLLEFYKDAVNLRIPALVYEPYRIEANIKGVGKRVLYRAEPGQSVEPRRYSVSELHDLEATLPPELWHAMYQQQPIENIGAFFKREWLEKSIVSQDAFLSANHEEPYVAAARGWDLAWSAREGADYSVGALGVMDGQGVYWLLDAQRFRADFDGVTDRLRSVFQADGYEVDQAIESAGLGAQITERLLAMPDLAAYRLHSVAARRDKSERAAQLQSRMAMGKVRIVNGDWTRQFIDELAAFNPKSDVAGAHDDCVDAAAHSFQWCADTLALPPLGAVAEFSEGRIVQ